MKNKKATGQLAAIPGAQPKIPLKLDEQGDLIPDMDYKYVLKRLKDGLTKRGNQVVYIEWQGEGKGFKEMFNEPALERSLLLDPGISFSWLTTTITEIIEKTETRLHFKTKNSEYVLEILG